MRRFLVSCLLLVALLVSGCGTESAAPPSLMTRLPPDSTGVAFANTLTERPDSNVLSYDYFYNGGGVAAGDLNGDDRPDLYLTANQSANALYLNEGQFRFRDVAAAAGVADQGGWTTGVTMADVNGDGRLDLYVCRSGWQGAEHRRNRLFVNQGTDADGVPQFEEQAAAYGLDDPSRSTHATFFDADRDGDLDLYLLNHATGRTRFNVSRADRQQRDALASDKLYEHRDGTFVDVTDAAGIVGSAVGYGLSATVSDVNGDGWPDLYVGNDYLADDRLYVNQGDGTFEDQLRARIDHTSYSTMGADVADYNNDARPDIVTLDMLPEARPRQKLLAGPKSLDFYRSMQARDYYHQYQRNMLHRNNGTGAFSEIGQLAGVATTGWSWAALLTDFDLDGFKDLYVTNGYRRDFTNLDYLHSVLFSNLDFIKYRNAENPDAVDIDLYSMVAPMPSTPVANVAFRNNGDLTFAKSSAAWGLGHEGFSTGAAYTDLNNDGAPDLVVNNIDETAWIYRNEAPRQTDHRFLTVELEGAKQNRYGVGATVELTTPEGRTLHQEMMPARGFQSSVEPALFFGAGTADTVSLTVTWPDQSQEHRPAVATRQTVTLRQTDAHSPDAHSPDAESAPETSPPERLMEKVTAALGPSVSHRENAFLDVRDQPLLPHMHSRLGPALAGGDVNGDGRDDVFVGGARGQPATLLVQRSDATFRTAEVPLFSAHRGYEDVDATFFDADGDADLDLYVVSGGLAGRSDAAYQDRLYLNDGTGGFTHNPALVPTITSSGGTVAAHDYNSDGTTDLFVGGRVVPGRVPTAPRSHLLANTGGAFEDVTASVAPALAEPGMITDALWHDLEGDGTTELVLAGEWMPIRVFRPGDGFAEATSALGFDGTEGWWNVLAAADLNGDGRDELVAGNRGRNAFVQAPAALYAADFSHDGSVDVIMTHVQDGTEYPVYWRDTLTEAIPPFRSRFDSYADYATASIDAILTEDERARATRKTVATFETSVFVPQADGTFRQQALPVDAQFAPIHGLLVRDLNGDDRPDLLLAGNDRTVRPQWGRADAEKGTVLLNRGHLRFRALDPARSGFNAPQDVRDLRVIDGTTPAARIVVGANNARLSMFSVGSARPTP